MKKKLSSRKLWLTIVAALLPIACQVLIPDMPAEKIVLSVVGILGGVWGLAKEDVEKIKAGIRAENPSEGETTEAPAPSQADAEPEG